MKTPPRISEAEWSVIKPIWQRPGITASEVIEALSPACDWSPATIKTLLNRLLQKGALRFEKEGKAYLYYPLFSEEDYRKAESRSFLSRVFDGAFSPMLAHFLSSERLSEKELDEIEKLIRQKREGDEEREKP